MHILNMCIFLSKSKFELMIKFVKNKLQPHLIRYFEVVYILQVLITAGL